MKHQQRNPIGEVVMQFIEPRRGRKGGIERMLFQMELKEMSQRDLAAALGWKSHSYLGRLIRGEVRTVDPDTAVKIAVILGIGVDDLFTARASSAAVHNVHTKRTVKAAA